MVENNQLKCGDYFHCDALRDLVPFEQFKKREKHQWSGINFSKVNKSKSNTPTWAFFTFLNCTNGTKSRKTLHFISDARVTITNKLVIGSLNKVSSFKFKFT